MDQQRQQQFFSRRPIHSPHSDTSIPASTISTHLGTELLAAGAHFAGGSLLPQQRRPLSVPPNTTAGGIGQKQQQLQQSAEQMQMGQARMPPASMLLYSGGGGISRPQQQQTIKEEEDDEVVVMVQQPKDEPDIVPIESDDSSAAGARSSSSYQQRQFTGGNISGPSDHLLLSTNVEAFGKGSGSPFVASAPSSCEQNISTGGTPKQKFGGGGDMEQPTEAAERAAQLEQQRRLRRTPIVLDQSTLDRAMRAPAEGELSPLEHFLHGQTLLARLQPLFELAAAEAQRSREQRGKFNLPVKELHWANGVLTVVYPSFPLPMGTAGGTDLPQHPHQCQLQLFMCPKEFRLKAKLEYTGANCPSDSDVRQFERFFVSQVVRLNNEMSVFAFVTLSRLSSPSIFAAFAGLMRAQMEPDSYPWRIELELLHLVEDQQQQSTQQQAGHQPTKSMGISVMVTELCKQILFLLWLRPNTQANEPPQQRNRAAIEKRRLPLRYYVERNALNILITQTNQMATEENQNIENMFKAYSAADVSAGQSQPCCIWPCIKALLEGKHQQQIQPAELPSSSMDYQQNQQQHPTFTGNQPYSQPQHQQM